MTNIYNIAPKNAQPLYAAYAMYHGIEICVTGASEQGVREELEREFEAIEVIEMAECEAVAA